MPRSRHVRTLMVEDEPDLIEVTRTILSKDQQTMYELESRRTLQESLAFLATTDVDVILLDLGLPDSRGLATFDAVRAAAVQTPIVVLTVTDDPATGLDAVRRGAQDYLVKSETDLRWLPRVLLYAIERKRADATARERDRLEQLNQVLMEREVRALELKSEVNELSHELGQPVRYQVDASHLPQRSA